MPAESYQVTSSSYGRSLSSFLAVEQICKGEGIQQVPQEYRWETLKPIFTEMAGREDLRASLLACDILLLSCM